MALESGTNLGYYEITEQIGKGGMGEVYRARDTRLGREVAIKVVPSEHTSAERIARLEREARMLASLNHPNIAAIHGLEESGETRFIVLELVEGVTLADRLESGPVPVEESLTLALQIAEALESAHEKGVIHRDLKPANIKVTPEGRVKVLDFGLAKALSPADTSVDISNSPTLSMAATQAGVIVGTPSYMSPEQAKAGTVDQKADIWAFGCVLFEMLSRHRVFAGEDASTTLARVLEREPDYGKLPPDLHPRVRYLLERCLEKDPQDRCQTAGEVRSELRKSLAEPAFELPGPVPTPSRAGKTLPWIVAVGMAAIAGLAVLGGQGEVEPRTVRKYSQPWPLDQLARASGRPWVAGSADGSCFAYNAEAGFYLRKLDEHEPRLIPGSEGMFLSNPFLSPDCEMIAFYSGEDGELQKMSVDGGERIPIAAAGNPYGATWEADGTILFGQPEGILRVAETGGEPQLIVRTEPGEQAFGPHLLPGRESILYTLRAAATASWDEAEIVVESLETHERTAVINGTDGRYVPTGHLVYAVAGSLWAIPFDVGSLTATTTARARVADGLSMSGPTGSANYGISDNGTLVHIYNTVGRASWLVYADRAGDIARIGLPADSTYGHPRVSPDGTLLAFEADTEGCLEIWVLEILGEGQPWRLTQGCDNSRPIWRDSEYVTFMSTRDGTPSIWLKKADRSEEPEQVTYSDGKEHWPNAWSPDGETLAYAIVGDGDQSIWTVTPGEGRNPVRYVQSSAGDSVFSRDGRWMAYRASRNQADAGNVQIFMKPFPESGQEQQVTRNGGSSPVFSHEGELIYRRPALTAGLPNELVSQTIAIVGQRVTPGTERVLPIEGIAVSRGVRDYDVMPESDRLVVKLMSTDVASVVGDGPAPEFRIVLDWFEELKEQVPVP